MKRTISLVLVLTLGMATQVVRADFTFGKPVDLGLGSGGAISVSADGLELYFTSDRSGGLGYEDIWVSTRQSTDEPWSPPVNLTAVNSTYREAYPSISPDGLTLYFGDYFYGPDRPGGLGGHDLWMSTRTALGDPWGTPVNMGAPFNSANQDVSLTISHDGLTFIFASDRPGGSGGYDLWMCTRPTLQDPWGPPVNMGPTVNSGSHDYYGNLSPDGRVLFFESDRSGSYAGWMTTRKSIDNPWKPPALLPAPLYATGVGCVAPDGSSFCSAMSLVPIVPVVDFNGDGIVDSVDMCIMVDHWGENYHLCDIGPTPLGDGIVDVQDLIVLAEHLFEDYRLVAHWALDEEQGSIAYDSTGQYDADLHGEPVWQPLGGKVTGALELDGVDDYVSTVFVLNPADGSFSVFAWIKGGAPGQVIISQADAEGQSAIESGGIWLGISQSDGGLMTGLMDIFFGPLESELVVADEQWHHVGLVYDYTTMKRHLYVDGTEVAIDDGIVAGVQSTAGLYIGAGQTLNTASFFSGMIDDVRIYNAALTAEQIAALAQ
jgi:hypothetical protein